MRNKNAKVSDPNKFFTYPGDDVSSIYGERVADDGSRVVVEIGTESIQEKIDSWAPYTDINYVMQRVRLGDTSVLHPGEPFYGDIPKGIDFRQVLELNMRAQEQFYQLDLATRESFDNDWRKYLSSAGSDDWYGKMSKYFQPVKGSDSDVKESDPVES